MQAEKLLTPAQIQTEIEKFNGADKLFRDKLTGIKWTPGVKFIADQCEAYWLINIIISCQLIRKVRREPFQVHRLEVSSGDAVFTIEDGNGNKVYSQKFWTDFPLDEIMLYFENQTIVLPAER